eukprot:Hpha_TRINITY_DN35388_c0_g1::TRINITY_DN35388_c0_g1_i1::g.85075::m.85075
MQRGCCRPAAPPVVPTMPSRSASAAATRRPLWWFAAVAVTVGVFYVGALGRLVSTVSLQPTPRPEPRVTVPGKPSQVPVPVPVHTPVPVQVSHREVGDVPQPPGECEQRGSEGGCGVGCFDMGMHRCCKRGLASGRELGHLDDVPWELEPEAAPQPRRIPKHDPAPLFPGGQWPWALPPGQREDEDTEARLPVCRGVWGEQLRTPAWLPPLWRRVVPFRERLGQRLVASPGWKGVGSSVLVIWVPSRFMPPQKPGKNVRGEWVDAATRGTNATYYLQEYGAVWHTSFEAGGMTYHAQVVSKKALVVCLWERLHVYRYDCGEPALPVHFCLCRHCKESFIDTRGVAGNARPPPTRHTEKASVYPRGGVPPTLSCVPAVAAPWLVPRSEVPKFPWEGLHNNLERLLEVQADENKVVVVFIFNRFWVDHLHNVVWSMVARAGVRGFIVATLDCESLELCAKTRMPCFNAINFAEPERDMAVGASGYKQGFKRKVTEELSWIKPRLALSILDLGFRFMMVDMDMSWNRNPMADVVSHSADFPHQCDTRDRFSINTGFYLLRPTPQVFRLFENILVFPPWRLSDQNALKLSTRYDHTHGATNGCLDRWRYNMKCNYKLGSERIEAGVRSFRWKPQQRDPSKFDWFIFHATCLDGAASKVAWLRTSNAWFLDDLDNMTERPGGYCVDLPDGRRLEGMRRRTLHSTNYQRGVDQRFLQERH